MYPVIIEFSVGGAEVVLRAYATFLVLGGIAALLLGVRAVGPLGVGRRRALAGFGLAIAAGLVGARIGSVLLELPGYAQDPAEAIELGLRGFALYGGLVAGALTMVVVARRWQISFASLADASILPIAVGLALVRVGCFLNGCCAGIETELPWAVTFPAGGSAWSSQVLDGSTRALFGHADAVHPTQLYEALAVLAIAGVALVLRRRRWPPGAATLAFTAGFLAFRVVNQLLRPETPDATLPAIVVLIAYAMAAVLAGTWLVIRLPGVPRPERLAAS